MDMASMMAAMGGGAGELKTENRGSSNRDFGMRVLIGISFWYERKRVSV